MQRLLNDALAHLDQSIFEYGRSIPGQAELALDDERRLGKWRATGYAEAGLLTRDRGDQEAAKRLLAAAQWLLALIEPDLGFYVRQDHREAIRELAPEPALPVAQ